MNVDTAIKIIVRYDVRQEIKAIAESTASLEEKAKQVQSATVQLEDGTETTVCNVADPKFKTAMDVLLGALTLQVYSVAQECDMVYNVPPHVIPAIAEAATGHCHVDPDEYNTHWVHTMLGYNLQALINAYDNHHIIYTDQYLYATFTKVD